MKSYAQGDNTNLQAGQCHGLNHRDDGADGLWRGETVIDE
jgi:hypothetical protein